MQEIDILQHSTYKKFDQTPKTQKLGLKFTQWNLLANWASSSDSFPKVNPDLLKFETRYPKIVSILRSLDSDVVCMQECDFFDELVRDLSDQYELSFHKKMNNADGTVIM